MNTRDAQAHGAGAGPDAGARRRRDDRTAREALDQSRHRARDRSRAARYAPAILMALAHILCFAPNRPDLPLSASVPLNSRVARAVEASRTSLGRTFLSSAA